MWCAVCESGMLIAVDLNARQNDGLSSKLPPARCRIDWVNGIGYEWEWNGKKLYILFGQM